MKLEWIINKESELVRIASDILKWNNVKNKYILLGDLGAGKTSFVKAMNSVLGSVDTVSSPSFSLVNIYQASNGKRIYHLDLYRIESMEEALDIGIEEYIASEDFLFIEWPEIIEPLIDNRFSKIVFELLEDQSRKINFIQNPA